MSRRRLHHLFAGAAAKRLAPVEADPARSNQHEFNGTLALQKLFGTTKREGIPARFIRFGDDGEVLTADGLVTWYDARERHPSRTEWRLYFRANDVMDASREGDLMVLARTRDERLFVILASSQSTIAGALLWLFGIEGEPGIQDFGFTEMVADSRELDFVAGLILQEIGLDIDADEDARIAELARRLMETGNRELPSTRELSRLARRHAGAALAEVDPDSALVAWLAFEEKLFRSLERLHLEDELRAGFKDASGNPDVDRFVAVALSVLNRRKSRMGLSLENHVEAVLAAASLPYERGAETEKGSRPDFLLPGAREYHDPHFDARRLLMLAVKSTLKDRWRQVLAEAERIPEKHLLTLQPGISVAQMDEMNRRNLQLVIPAPVAALYEKKIQSRMMTVREFILFARERLALDHLFRPRGAPR